MQTTLIRLQCGLKTYNWGKVGNSSIAAKFAAATADEDLVIQDEVPYAEVKLSRNPYQNYT